MNHKYLIFIIVLLSYRCCLTAHAFDDAITHRKLTEAAINNNPSPSLKKTVAAFTGYSSGFKKMLQGTDRKGNDRKRSILEWFQEGSTDEDALNLCRASNHFHNPIPSPDWGTGDWHESQMTDSVIVDSICGTTNRYSAVTWATGFISPTRNIGPRIGKYISNSIPQDFLYDVRQDMGWDGAREYIYTALTSTTPAIREENFVKTFKAVGQVMHLMQDMAVPAHVRNDMTSHLLNSRYMKKWFSNPFEKYVSKNDSAMKVYMTKSSDIDKPSFTAPIRLSDFWDTNTYTGNNPSAGTNQGLAEYTNANFVSDFTIFKPQSDTKHYFKYPAQTSAQAVNAHIKDPFNWGNTLTRKYYLKTGDGDTGYLLAGVGYLDVKVGTYPYETIKTLPPMDNYVHDDYAKKILPRAVGYSAALLDYFFRGKLSVTATPTEITFSSIKVTATNSTPNETMGTGDISLVIRYKPLAETGSGLVKTLTYPSAEYSYKVATLTNVDMTTAQTLTFDFSANALPMSYSDMTMQLVFKGKLGNEEGAVAVSAPSAINGIYSGLNLSLPTTGVYAKTSDSLLSATFNELKMNVSNNTTADLTGGTFELMVRYRTATDDPFQSQPVITEPAGAYAYAARYPANSGASTLPKNTSADIVFDLSSAPLSVKNTDVELFVSYKNSSNQPIAIGYRNIAEPTPVDVFNNTDKVCIYNQWYDAGSAAASAAVGTDMYGNPNSDVFPHRIDNIYYKSGPVGSTSLIATQANINLSGTGLSPGVAQRLGYVLTDNQFSFTFDETYTALDSRDHWVFNLENLILNGSGFVNQDTTQSSMYTMRGNKMWSGSALIYDNEAYPANAHCDWSTLP